MPTLVTVDLELASGSAGGALSNEIVNDIRAVRTYVDVHTEANPNGEGRGQLIPARSNLQKRVGAVRTEESDAMRMSARYLPSTEVLHFTFGAAPRERRVILYDALGRILREAACDGDRAEMPASDLAPGLYLVQLMEGSRTVATGRVMVVR